MRTFHNRLAPFIRIVSGIVLLAAAIGGMPPAHAATVAVTNCKDAGLGSLRAAVPSAASGDTVDLRLRHCTILLTTGEIAVRQTGLRLLGPGAGALTITSNLRSRVFNHSGSGTLRVERLSIINSGASEPHYASAGCIRSFGSVELHHARLDGCFAYGVPDPDCEFDVCSSSWAGAIDARRDVLLAYSTISDSWVSGLASSGGGISNGGWLTLYRSRLLRNGADDVSAADVGEGFTAVESVIADNGSYEGGAVHVRSGPADIRGSTFAGNTTEEERGCSALCTSGSIRITNSTFSHNRDGSAAAISGQNTSIFNSTIAFNHATYDQCHGAIEARGTLRLDSTIIAGNTCASVPVDLIYDGSIAGSHDLVVASSSALPHGTLRSNPFLKPLARDGGFTPTHALGDGSPAINRGSNVLGLKYDQRGPGFPRTKGGCTDIGAFER